MKKKEDLFEKKVNLDWRNEDYIIPDNFKNEDVLYHYTSFDIAYEKILYEMQLKFSLRSVADDPYESFNFYNRISLKFQSDSSMDKETLKERSREISIRINKIIKSQTYCLYFCMNNIKADMNNGHYVNEHFGFAKPRMWSQFGRKHTGVCLVFLKSKLVDDFNKDFDNVFFKHSDDTIYSMFKDFLIDMPTITEVTEILEKDVESYLKYYFQKNIGFYFKKHIDYQDEDEYKFMIMKNEDDKNDVFLNINKSLVGIIISDKCPEAYHEILKKKAEVNNIFFRRIHWDYYGNRLIKF